MNYFLPVVVAVALWWGFTIAALYRTGLPEKSYRSTLALASGLALAGLALLAATTGNASPAGAYAGFFGALSIWCWHEVSYFLGFVTGPRPQSCPDDCSQWQRFVHGVQASLYHELAIVATAVALVALTWGQPNQAGAWTFCVLWLMRWSAKMNIFFGVRNLHLEYLPARLQYLGSYVSRRDMNALFPVSVTLAGLVAALVIADALAVNASAYTVTASMLIATLLALALLEHVFLMLKVPDGVLWRLGTLSRSASPEQHEG